MKNNIKVEELTIEGVIYVPKNSKISKVIEVNGEDSPWEIGKNYLIRTVTMIQIGRLEKVTEKELVISNACWVADTGRFHKAIETGILNEVEVFNCPVIVGRGALVDATEWLHELPKVSK